MRLFWQFLIPVIFTTFIINGCAETLESSDSISENQIDWRGVLDSAPANPEQNWVYFDLAENVTFIFSDTGWDTMSISGLDGVNLNWLGALDSFPEEGVMNSVFFHNTDSVSYIFTDTSWDTLSISGTDGISIDWRGTLLEAPTDAVFNTGYHNSITGMSYIYNGGEWEIISIDGIAGEDLIWLGTSETVPLDPVLNSAYYNSTDKVSYVFDGTAWQVICRDGLEGEEGESLLWLGALPEAPTAAENLNAYYNTTDKITYIYNGVVWEIFAKSGADGKDFIWLGEFDVHPDPNSSIANTGYFNTTDSTSYIFDGTAWNTLCNGGKDGINGTNGLDGIAISWLGSYHSAPTQKSINNAYFNLTDSTSYIFDGTNWRILAKSGKDGVIINWRGSSTYVPYNPQEYDAYFDTDDRNSYIYIQGGWQLLSQGGQDGVDGLSITWLGSFKTKPYSASQNDAYYNTNEGITYIYNNGGWEIFSKDGKDGEDAFIETDFVRGYVESGDTLRLTHNMSSYDLHYNAQYYTEGNLINSISYIDPNWINPYVETLDTLLYSDQSTIRKLKRLSDNSVIHLYSNFDSMYKGGWFAPISESGSLGDLIRFSDKTVIALFDMVELDNGTKAFSYLDMDKDGRSVVSFVNGSNNVTLVTIDSLAGNIAMCKSGANEVAVFTTDSLGRVSITRVSEDSIESRAVVVDTVNGAGVSSYTAEMLSNGTIALAHKSSEGTFVSIVGTDNSVLSSEIITAGVDAEVKDMILQNSKLFLHLSYRDSAVISRLSTSGIVEADTTLEDVTDMKFQKLNDSQLIMMVKQKSRGVSVGGLYYTIPACNKVEVLNEDFSIYSSNKFSKFITNFEFVVLDDKSLAVTQTTSSYDSGKLYYTHFEVSTLSPRIFLKAFSSNQVGLINATGRPLEMSIGVIKSRAEHPNALKAER